ncbi:MAG: hypothetical protein K2J38_04325 [Muribaculaceae bacterium]|nr:hypothetical protein [Muribaculaceae bacterium]
MQGILSRFRCWRHGKGFGIHSPFAYALITEVLRQRHPYYGYADISPDQRIRLLFRLVTHFRPEGVLIVSSQPRLLQGAVQRASSRVRIGASDADFIVADAADCTPDALAALLHPGVKMLVLNALPGTSALLSSRMPCGMLFDNRRGTLFAAVLPHLPRQTFEVRF